MSYPGGQGSNPNEDPDAAASGGYEAPPIEQSPGSAFETPSAPIDYPPPGYYMDPPPAPTPGYPPPAPTPAYPGYPPPGYPGSAGPYPTGYPGAFGPYPPDYVEGYGAPPPVAGTNSMAIGALVAAVIGVFCGIGSLIGIVLGFLALNQIKSTGQAGRGLAIGAIVVGCATIVVGLLWVVVAMSI